ncbi:MULTISPECIES: ANTAR domain-containing response regulator [Martelella]|uniref:ANTAR domain-containing response regulator n=2 Tax=Martelella TaxID=293088 RepID=A0A5C4JN32_9HYPH|nr:MULTISPECIES: ANTAR domain-containing response regulator [Martelella]MBB4123555.1 response regulator NasT [Martelella radicis]TNB46728.1 ANTAR domain-containing response regulator [Martelella lutilitoris]
MNNSDLAILVIDENAIRAAIIRDGLLKAGHHNVTVVEELVGVARTIERLSPDVIVIDIENPNRDMLESLFVLSRTVKKPIAMFVDRSDAETIHAAVEAGVSAYVVDGLKQERVKPILDMAISRFNAFSRMAQELEAAKSQLENRKVVDRAKALLMKSRGMDEEKAYALLRRTAMDQNRKIVDVAQSLIMTFEMLER